VKFDPVAVRVNPGPLAIVEVGDIELRMGRGCNAIVNVRVEEAPATGVYTVTPAVPVSAISDARIEHRNWVALTYVVVRLDPFHLITEFAMKLEPVTVRVNPEPPATA
jgi:hypothetical protein